MTEQNRWLKNWMRKLRKNFVAVIVVVAAVPAVVASYKAVFGHDDAAEAVSAAPSHETALELTEQEVEILSRATIITYHCHSTRSELLSVFAYLAQYDISAQFADDTGSEDCDQDARGVWSPKALFNGSKALARVLPMKPPLSPFIIENENIIAIHLY